MPTRYTSHPTAQFMRELRKAVDAHYRRRGIPDNALEACWWKWRKNKGLRMPQTS